MPRTPEQMRAQSMIFEAIAKNGEAFVNPASENMMAAADALVKRGAIYYRDMQGGYRRYRENTATRAELERRQDAAELAACRRVPGGF